ncbi:MAG: type I asparaginase, partial [Bacteroidota bacterium]
TGGTIGMVEDPATGQLTPFDFEGFTEQVPELQKLEATLEGISFDHPIDSSNMQPEIWVKLAHLIREHYDRFDGFVILHGSDTLAYTASALSFMLEGLHKAVILTGAQLPVGVIRSDGKENLITAIELAAARQINGRSVVPEVAVYFEYKLYRGNRTQKVNAEGFEAFLSPNYPLLAEAGVHIRYNTWAIALPDEGPLTVHDNLCTDMAVLQLFPGISPATVHAILGTKNLRALILYTYGAGNAPTDPWFLEALETAIRSGVLILNVTQCVTGRVEQGRYETSAGLERIGVIGGVDLTLEAAVTKLMVLLGRELEPANLLSSLQTPLCGEMTA